MYQFVTGPLAWIAFSIFGLGMLVRIVWYIRGLDWKLDRVPYRQYPLHALIGALRSIIFWLIPFGTHSWRKKPIITILLFVFHVGLLGVPLFLLAHNMLLKQGLGISLWTMPEKAADILTVVMILAGLGLFVRRMALPEVRIITTSYDILLLAITLAPFITGFIARQVAASDPFWVIVHIISAEITLIAIPFTKLAHVITFFLSRAQLGVDFGTKRGGLKGSHMAW